MILDQANMLAEIEARSGELRGRPRLLMLYARSMEGAGAALREFLEISERPPPGREAGTEWLRRRTAFEVAMAEYVAAQVALFSSGKVEDDAKS